MFSCSVLYKGSPEFELLVISIHCSVSPSPDFCIALFYRPPSSTYLLLDNLFTTLCNIFISLPSNVLLIGDFNVDFLVPHSCLYSKLLSVVSSFNLTQIVSEPTRVTESSSTLIDLIFVSPTVIVKQCSTLPPLANADHYGLQLIVSTKSQMKRSKPVTRRIWRYTLADFDRAAELFDTIEWTNLLPDNVDAFWSAWKTYFLQIMEICIPSATVKVKRNVPWMNKDISVGIKQRNKLFQTAKRSGKSSDRTKYNRKRNQVVKILRTSKQLFFNRLNTADSKTFWRTVRLLNHQNTSIPTLHDNGTEIESSETKANALNKIFL